MENFIYNIVTSKAKHRLIGFTVLFFLLFSIAMIPLEIVLAKMLPGKSANTFSIYVDTVTNSTMEQTKEVVECVAGVLKKEKDILHMEMFLGQGVPLDYAGLVKGSSFKRMKNQAEISVNLTDKHNRDEASYMMVHRLRPLVQEKCTNIYKNTTIKFVEMPAGPPTFATIVVNLYGEDSQLMRETAKVVAHSMEDTEGLVDIADMTPYSLMLSIIAFTLLFFISL